MASSSDLELSPVRRNLTTLGMYQRETQQEAVKQLRVGKEAKQIGSLGQEVPKELGAV